MSLEKLIATVNKVVHSSAGANADVCISSHAFPSSVEENVIDSEGPEAALLLFNTTLPRVDKLFSLSTDLSESLCDGLQQALADTRGNGCGPKCSSRCLAIFCLDNPAKANELHEVGSKIFQQYRDGIQGTPIRSAGVGARARNVNNSVKTFSVGGSIPQAVQPALRRRDFLETSREKRRDALVQFGTKELPKLLKTASEGGAGVCGFAASTLIGALSVKTFYEGPLAKVLIDEDLRRKPSSGSRSARGLLPLETLARPEPGNECCKHQCLQLLGEQALDFLWSAYEEAEGTKAQDLAALNGVYFNPASCRPGGLCNNAICLLLGHESRIYYWGGALRFAPTDYARCKEVTWPFSSTRSRKCSQRCCI